MNFSTLTPSKLVGFTLILFSNLFVMSTFAAERAPSSGPLHANSACVSSDPEHMCMGVRMESYTQNGNPVLSEIQAEVLIAGINKIWAPCNIAFQLEKYEAVEPTKLGLDYDVNWEVDGDTVRSQFQEKNKFLVVSVGQLTGPTIGVTAMPGSEIYGALIHEDYTQNQSTVGHELGHYMGLYHVDDDSNLMAANIGPATNDLSPTQCETARATNQSDWSPMMRH